MSFRKRVTPHGNEERGEADVVVSIDFGNVGTAVAISYGPEWPDVELITSWEGNDGRVLATKVPTRVSYYADDATKVKAWGFCCDFDTERESVKKGFKAALDPYQYGYTPDGPTVQDACRYTVDFLSCLYIYIVEHLVGFPINWGRRKVDFVFSLPRTWSETTTQTTFRALIDKTGFSDGHRHNLVILDISEAEATAYSALPQNPRKNGDAVIVCHAGALVSVCELLIGVTASNGETMYLTKASTKARTIGSALIDYEIQRLIIDSFQSHPLADDADPEVIARYMMQGSYRTYKHSFGSGGWRFSDLELSYLEQRIKKCVPRRFILTEEEVKVLFDKQIDKLFALLEHQLDITHKLVPNQHIQVIMSGGFSNNPYVQKRFGLWETELRARASTANFSPIFTADGKLQIVEGLVKQRVAAAVFKNIILIDYDLENKYWDRMLGKLIAISEIESPALRTKNISRAWLTLTTYLEGFQNAFEEADHLGLEERVSVAEALSGVSLGLSGLLDVALGSPPQTSKAAEKRKKQSGKEFVTRLENLVACIQRLDLVMTLRVSGKSGAPASSIRKTPEVHGLDDQKQSKLSLPDLHNVLQHRASWASSVITTNTKISTTTTLEADQESIILAVAGTPFRIARDGSRITSGNDQEISPPPYSATIA